jgi:hypothetical protein
MTDQPSRGADEPGMNLGLSRVFIAPPDEEVPMLHAQFAIVRETTEVIVQRLEGLPPSERAKLLRDCVEETAHWSQSPPTPRDLQVFAKRLFVLHVEITKLERVAAAAINAPGVVARC